ncbi:MAG: Gfo/Idh/MocA family oxidoreductase [Bacteroidales bacterium]|nr:Gfo/Idh/MocA family oxidoreductase [Bacteroidales bacterium]MCF8333174.1 Gfo/Idh/MocA family oxidoreductase [Bacteroidales bacterium]
MIHWGILGTGKIASLFAKDFQYVSNGELVAVASRNPDKAHAFARKHNIRDVHISYEALAKWEDIDAVYIATPHNRHFDDARICLENGKSVLCEKPITVNTQQLKELQKLAEANDVYLMEAMWTWFLPAFNKAVEWYRQGRIGDVRMISSAFGFPAKYYPDGRLYNPELAGGTLLDLGIYNLFTVNRFMDREPESITATAHMADTGVDEHLAVTMTYPGDIMAQLASAFSCKLQSDAIISGTKGLIRLPRFWEAKKAILETSASYETFEDTHPCKGYYYETQRFNEWIQQKKTGVPYPMENSLRIMQQMDEIRRQIGLKYPFE